MQDDIGDRMKNYELVETDRRIDYKLPVYARLDGRGFSKFTKNFDRPYDKRFSDMMIDVTEFLVSKTDAVIGYTQSDEISLVWKPMISDEQTQRGFFFDGKVQKLCSILSGMATARLMGQLTPELQQKFPHFDCRVLSLPNQMEAANMVSWREMDARKNAISALARAHYSHTELHKKSGKQMLDMLAKKNVSMSSYPAAFSSGTFVRRETVQRNLTEEEMSHIPEHKRPDGPVSRTVVNVLENTSVFSRIKNKDSVIFDNASIER